MSSVGPARLAVPIPIQERVVVAIRIDHAPSAAQGVRALTTRESCIAVHVRNTDRFQKPVAVAKLVDPIGK